MPLDGWLSGAISSFLLIFPTKPKPYKVSRNPSNHRLAINYSVALRVSLSPFQYTSSIWHLERIRHHMDNVHIWSFVRNERKGKRPRSQDSLLGVECNFPLSVDYWGLGDLFKVLSGLGFCPCPIHSHRLHPDWSKKWDFWNVCEASVSAHCQRKLNYMSNQLRQLPWFFGHFKATKKCRTHSEISCKPRKSLIFKTQLEFYEDNSYQILYREKLFCFIQLLERNNYALYNLKCICIPSK